MGQLWFGGKIYTMTGPENMVEAIYTDHGKIIETGYLKDLKNKYKQQIDDEIRFEGVLFPGFIDSHLHIIGHGEKLLRLDLSDVQSRKEVIQKFKSHQTN